LNIDGTIVMKRPISFTLNGRPVTLNADGERTLLWVLRTDFGLTGTKYGCGEGVCGACAVIADGKAVRSCLTKLTDIEGCSLLTIEGLANNGELHPVQQAFMDHGALQCGYCTSGMLLSAAAFLRDTPNPSRDAIISHMERNLCRCGAHQRIIAAIETAARRMSGPT
jgi:aerobic-type carbon monoxide dehydrogenase small subunit (CoxS/CutS family)